jgi:hypothetical protein
MITRVEVLNFRCLRDVSVPMDRFRILVGPNASGKSTFLDALRFVRDVLQPEKGPAGAARDRSPDPRDLLWRREGSEFQIAVELRPPAELVPGAEAPLFRYELAIGCPLDAEPRINAEALWFWPESSAQYTATQRRDVFPEMRVARTSLMAEDVEGVTRRGRHKVVAKVRDSGRDYYSWRFDADGGAARWNQVIYVGRSRAALGFLPEGEDDPSRYLAPRWARQVLADSLLFVQLDVGEMRRPSSPLDQGPLKADGSNLSWVMHAMEQTQPGRLSEWLAHVRTMLPEIDSLRTIVRDEDRHCYFEVLYRNGARVPMWLLSDGTLRTLALTMLAYYPWDGFTVIMVEEPENGIHPRAMEGIYQSLSSIWRHHVLLASHSPPLLAIAEPSEILCFSTDGEGATDVVRGEDHPALRDWDGQLLLDHLNHAGVLS